MSINIRHPQTSGALNQLTAEEIADLDYDQMFCIPGWEDAPNNWAGDEVPDGETVMAHSGGCTVIVGRGGVGRGSTIVASGGGVIVTVYGNVGPRARIIAIGGAATIVVHGEVDPTADLYAAGGNAAVVLLGPNRRGPGITPPATARGGGAKVMER